MVEIFSIESNNEVMQAIRLHQSCMEDAPKPPVQPTVNNPFVFNFNQYGNNGTQIGHIENYYAGKRKEDCGNE